MIKVFLKSLVLFVPLLCSCDEEGKKQPSCQEADTTFYFAQSASSAVIESHASGLRLTLSGVSRTTWFTDRPKRDAGLLDNGAFAAIWDELGIKKAAPTGITVAKEKSLVTSIVALSDPKWDTDTGVLTYQISPFADGYGIGGLSEGPIGPAILSIDPTILAVDCGSDDDPSLLFVQSGTSGKVLESNDALEIEVSGIVATTFFFDQPDRECGVVHTGTFIDHWATSPDLESNPPNAVLNIPGRTDGPQMVVVELSEPRIANDSVLYSAKVLPDEEGKVPSLPQTFGEFALFIDAFPTAINNQITDSVTQSNTKVLGDAPAIAMGNLFIATSQALANAAHNATNSQQQSYVTSQSATTAGVALLYSLDTASTGVSTASIF